MKSFFCNHDWEIIAFQNYYDLYDGNKAPSNSGTMLCKKCMKIKTFSNYHGGFLDGKILREIYDKKEKE